MAGNSKTSFDQQVLDHFQAEYPLCSSLEVSRLQQRSQQLSVGGDGGGYEDAPFPQLQASSKERGTDWKTLFQGEYKYIHIMYVLVLITYIMCMYIYIHVYNTYMSIIHTCL